MFSTVLDLVNYDVIVTVTKVQIPNPKWVCVGNLAEHWNTTVIVLHAESGLTVLPLGILANAVPAQEEKQNDGPQKFCYDWDTVVRILSICAIDGLRRSTKCACTTTPNVAYTERDSIMCQMWEVKVHSAERIGAHTGTRRRSEADIRCRRRASTTVGL